MSIIQQMADERKARLKRMNGPAIKDDTSGSDLRHQLATLQIENRLLRGQNIFVNDLPSHWEIKPSAARILLLLANSPKGFASYETIERVCRLTGPNARNTAAVHISGLRKVADSYGIKIKTWPGQGYMLSRDSLAKLRELAAA